MPEGEVEPPVWHPEARDGIVTTFVAIWLLSKRAVTIYITYASRFWKGASCSSGCQCPELDGIVTTSVAIGAAASWWHTSP